MSIRSFNSSVAALAVFSIAAAFSAFAADFPTGNYTANGLVMTFDDKGQFKVDSGGTIEVSGTYSVEGTKIKVTDVKGPWACTNVGEKTGAYTWKFDGDALTLSQVADSCKDRSTTLAGALWKHQK